jgi:hypothetical protein
VRVRVRVRAWARARAPVPWSHLLRSNRSLTRFGQTRTGDSGDEKPSSV